MISLLTVSILRILDVVAPFSSGFTCLKSSLLDVLYKISTVSPTLRLLLSIDDFKGNVELLNADEPVTLSVHS